MVRAVQGEPYVQSAATRQTRPTVAGGRRLATGPVVRTALLLGLPAVLVGILAWPMLFTGNAFNEDWVNHLWYMWNQSQAIRANLHPSLFLNNPHGVFYPQYAFYGGTIYALAGTLSLLLGEAPLETYVITYLMGFAASYGGWYWLARMAGLGRWWAQAPGAIFITSAYYITLIYARGDWPEFLAVSTIPLLLAAGLSVLRSERLRIGPAVALAGSSIVFFGAHNLTMVWGSTVIVLTGVLVLLCVPQVRKWLTPRGTIRVVCLVVPGFLVNAWFLLPLIAYEAHTMIGVNYPFWRLYLESNMFIVDTEHIFSLSRTTAFAPGSVFVVVLPLVTIAWALISVIIFLRRGVRNPWTRVLLICAGVTTLMGVVMTHASLILALPRPYAMLQFSYRLESYVLLGVSGSVLVALVLARSGTQRTRIWAWSVVPVVALSILGGVQQTSRTDPWGSRTGAVEAHSQPGPTEAARTDYADANLPLLEDHSGQPVQVNFPVASVRDERVSKVVHLRPGSSVYSDIGTGPELVHVTGAKIIGIDPYGNDVLEIGPSTGAARTPTGRVTSPWTEVISVGPANGLPIVLGRWLSVAAIAFLIGGLAVLLVHRARAQEPNLQRS